LAKKDLLQRVPVVGRFQRIRLHTGYAGLKQFAGGGGEQVLFAVEVVVGGALAESRAFEDAI
jgi:hypothetical protein